MHEQSLAKALLTQVEQIVREQGETGVKTIVVEAGPLAGVEPLLLKQAFATLRNGPTEHAELVVESSPLLAACRACDQQFELQTFNFCCPNCDAGLHVLRGDALLLDRVEFTSRSGREQTPTPDHAETAQ